ncbi:MAG: AsmA family protein, partial [Bacteroidales bacterium]|nr:AsmA family protein [Bacteroidales bacterium]
MNDGQDTGVPVKKRNWCLAIIKKILLVFAGLIVLTGIVISLLLYTVFTPEKVTPVVLGLVNNYLDAQVECESVEITFFSTFPDLGILMKNGKIINRDSALRATGLPQDTLVSFRRCLVSFNPVAFLTDRKVIIKKLEIAGPQIYAFVNTTGNANWNILSPDTIVIADTIVVTDTIKEPVFNLSEMNISDVRIKDAYIIYDDRKQGIFAALDSLDLGIDGNMSKDSTDLDFKFGIKSITAVYGGRILTKRLPLKFDARMHSNVLKSRVEMQQASITIGTLAFNVKGFIQGDTATHLAFVDMELGLGASSLSELLLMIPEQYSTLGKKVVATGKFDSYCHIYGHLGKEKLPGMKLSLQLEEGSLRSARHPENPGIKKIELGADAEIDFTGERPSYVRIDKIFLQSTSSVINCSGDLRDIFTRPYVQAHIDGNIDFNRLSRDLALSDSMQ